MNKNLFFKTNKDIALFESDEPDVLRADLEKAGTLESMHYHDDWNCLMPVVLKIGKNELVERFKIDSFGCTFYLNSAKIDKEEISVTTATSYKGTLLMAVYEAVVTFVMIYNTYQSKQDLVEFRDICTKLMFSYLRTRELSRLVDNLKDTEEFIATKTNMNIPDGGLWFKFGKDDTLATTIDDIRYTLSSAVDTSKREFLLEQMRSVTTKNQELYVYFS